jgi:DNA-binding MarR family transcriptional regulator
MNNMGKKTISESNYNLAILLSKVNHSLLLSRQKELRQYLIPIRQAHILRTLKALGSKATTSEVARQVERRVGVVSKQAICMEKEGLIKRIKNTPKSNLLTLELTEKGLDLAESSRYSKSIDAILSCLTKEEHRQMELSLNKIIIKLEKYSRALYKDRFDV